MWLLLTLTVDFSRMTDELTTGYCTKTYNLFFSGMIKGFYVPYPGKAEPAYNQVLPHEQKGADIWITHRNHCGGVHQPPSGIIRATHA